jgi:hypothetical protein
LSIDVNSRETRAAFLARSVDNACPQSKEMDMLMKTVRKGSGPAAQTLQPQRWRSAHTLDAVQQMNERCLGVLRTLAGTEPTKYPFEIVTRFRDLWHELDSGALKRAAKNPVLLVDVHFQSENWWRRAMHRGAGNGKGARANECFPPKLAGELMRETLMLAWPTARENPQAAGLLFGMTSEVAALVGALTPQHIESVASRHSRELRPRWEDMPAYWQSLLIAAQIGDGAALREVHLYSLQLIANELGSLRG